MRRTKSQDEQPPRLTKRWFHTGAWLQDDLALRLAADYWIDDPENRRLSLDPGTLRLIDTSALEGISVQDQIDATIKDAVERARSRLAKGPGRARCADCDAPIPEARRVAVPGVRLCVACQEAADHDSGAFSGYNRRGSKDSQLR